MENIEITQINPEPTERGVRNGEVNIGRPPLPKVNKLCLAAFSCLPTRYTTVIMIFLGLMITFGMRTNLWLTEYMQKEYNNHLFFYLGYLISLIHGGYLSFKYPANKVFGISIVGSSLLNLLVAYTLPIMDVEVVEWVCLLQGLVEGVSNSAFLGILRFWAPSEERSRLVTLAGSGAFAGVLISVHLTYILINYMDYQAPFLFYGFLGIIWYFFWNWLCFESPRKHPTISQTELEYIENSLEEEQTPADGRTTICCGMMSSMPVYAIIVSSFVIIWNYTFLMAYLYELIRYNFNFELYSTGKILVYLILAIVVPISGVLADLLRSRGILSTTNVRKVFFCASFGIQGLIFLIVLNATSLTSALLGLFFCVLLSGFGVSVYIVNHLDIAHSYATILTCVSYVFAMLFQLFITLVYEEFWEANSPITEFELSLFSFQPKEVSLFNFALAVGVQWLGCIFYGIFASAELQPWAKPRANNGRVLALPSSANASNNQNINQSV